MRITTVLIGACLVCMLFSFKKKQKLPTLSTAKEISKQLCKIKDNLYAWETETSNYEYGLFVKAMQLTQPNNWQQYAIDTTGWRKQATYCEPYVAYYHQHPAFNLYPVVNISYVNALAYCNWLTTKYNTDEKRKFKKVVFTLPTQEEWIEAAQGGRPEAMYPWGSYFVKNKKGMDLCNYKKDSSEIKDVHKLYSTASVKSFFPNSFGLYNCSGNVSEMLITQNKASGGSWNQSVDYCQIKSVTNYSESSPEIGFRVFMKVIEQ
jgi:formylglycine-generating enzyme